MTKKGRLNSSAYAQHDERGTPYLDILREVAGSPMTRSPAPILRSEATNGISYAVQPLVIQLGRYIPK
jgi:hypothetical protein